MFGIGANHIARKPISTNFEGAATPQFKGHFAFQKPEPAQPIPQQDELIRIVRTAAGEGNFSMQTMYVDDIPEKPEGPMRSSKISDRTVAFLVLSVADAKDKAVQAALNQSGQDHFDYAETRAGLTQKLVTKWNAMMGDKATR